MAYIFNVNTLYASTFDLAFNLKTLLIAAGWTVTKSGTGNAGSFSGSGDLISSSGVLSNTRAWFVISAPAVSGQVRQFCIQNVNGEAQWRVKYSASTGFITGSPSANTTPSAADEVVITGNGTDASPGGNPWIDSSSISGQNGYYHIIASNAAPYQFFLFGKRSSSNFWNSFGMDVATNGAPGDNDLAVILLYVTQTGGIDGNNMRVYSTFNRSWYNYGGMSPAFQSVVIPWLLDNTGLPILPGALGVNAHTNKDDLVPCMWLRAQSQSGPYGYKGVSALFKYIGTNRAYGDTLSVASAGAKDYVHVGTSGDPSVVIPWNGTVPVT